MGSSATNFRAPLAADVEVTDEALTVVLQDGRRVSVPLGWYPRLTHGTPAERREWRVVGQGEGIHWPQLNEDVSVAHLLQGMPRVRARVRWIGGSPRGRRDRNASRR